MIEPLIRDVVTNVSDEAKQEYIRWFIKGIESTVLEEPGSALELAQHVVKLCELRSTSIEVRGYYVAQAILGYHAIIDNNFQQAIAVLIDAIPNLSSEDIALRCRSKYRLALCYARIGKTSELRQMLRDALSDEGIVTRSEKLFLTRTVLFASYEYEGQLSHAVILARKVLLTPLLVVYPFQWCSTLIGYASITRTHLPIEFRQTLQRIVSLSVTMRSPLANILLEEFFVYHQFSRNQDSDSYNRLEELSNWYGQQKLNFRTTQATCRLLWYSLRPPYSTQFDVIRRRAHTMLRTWRSVEATRHFLPSDFLMTVHRGDTASAKRILAKIETLLSVSEMPARIRHEIRGFVAFANERIGNVSRSITLWQDIINSAITTHEELLDMTGIFELSYSRLIAHRWHDVLTTFDNESILRRTFVSDKEQLSRSLNQLKTALSLRHDEPAESDVLATDVAMRLLATSQSIYTLQALIASKRRELHQLLAAKSRTSPQLSAVVHDLRNTLASVRMIALIQSGKGVRRSTLKVLEAALGTVRWLKGSLDDNSVSSEPEHEVGVSRQSSDDIITSVISVCLPVARRRQLRIVYHQGPKPLYLDDYEARLYRCITFNAVNNAVQHCPPNNLIHVGSTVIHNRYVFYVNNKCTDVDSSVLEPYNSAQHDSTQNDILDLLSNTALHGLGSSIIRRFGDLLQARIQASLDNDSFRLAVALPMIP